MNPPRHSHTTAHAALDLGRRAICVEQSPSYIERIWSDCGNIEGASERLDVMLGDARDLDGIADDSVGLAVTSPPYWNKADYGDGEANLGNIQSYPGFIRALRPAFEEVYRVLAPGRKFCIVTANVNQHTDHGLLTFPPATDLVLLLREIGFVLINELVWSKDGTGGKWGSWGKQRPIFGSYPYPPNFFVQERPRVHHRCRQAADEAHQRQDRPALRRADGAGQQQWQRPRPSQIRLLAISRG